MGDSHWSGCHRLDGNGTRRGCKGDSWGAGTRMDEEPLDQDAATLDEAPPDEQKTYAHASLSTNDDVPIGRRKVGVFVKSLVQSESLTIKAFLAARGLSTKKSKFDKIIQGRKQIKQEEALLLVELFGGYTDFWISLEYNILDNPNITVPISSVPPQIPMAAGGTMPNGAEQFNGAANLTSDQLMKIKLAADGATVLGEGKDMIVIPKDTPVEVAKYIIDAWFAKPAPPLNDMSP